MGANGGRRVVDWLKGIGSNPVEVAAALLALIALYFAWTGSRAQTAQKRRERILDTRMWDDMIATLQPDWANRYYAAIAASTGWFDRVYGPRLLGGMAFDRALTFAFLYSFTTFIMGWVLFDIGTIGGVQFIASKDSILERLIHLFTSLLGPIFLYYLIKSAISDNTLIIFGKIFSRDFQKTARTLLIPVIAIYSLSSTSIMNYTYFLSFTLAIAGSGAGAVAFALSLGATFVYFCAFSFVEIDYLPFFDLDYGTVSDSELLFMGAFLFFMLLLPTINSIADYISIAATRFFLRRIMIFKANIFAYILWLLIDIAIASICIVILIYLITKSLDVWDAYFPIILPLDWRQYRATVCGGDWRAGTMLWLMLATTLAPTALHLAAGLGAVFSHRAQLDRTITDILTETRARFVQVYGDAALQELDRDKAERAFATTAALHQVETALAQKEGRFYLASATLFVAFMAGLLYGVYVLAHTFAMPVLCP